MVEKMNRLDKSFVSSKFRTSLPQLQCKKFYHNNSMVGWKSMLEVVS